MSKKKIKKNSKKIILPSMKFVNAVYEIPNIDDHRALKKNTHTYTSTSKYSHLDQCPKFKTQTLNNVFDNRSILKKFIKPSFKYEDLNSDFPFNRYSSQKKIDRISEKIPNGNSYINNMSNNNNNHLMNITTLENQPEKQTKVCNQEFHDIMCMSCYYLKKSHINLLKMADQPKDTPNSGFKENFIIKRGY